MGLLSQEVMRQTEGQWRGPLATGSPKTKGGPTMHTALRDPDSAVATIQKPWGVSRREREAADAGAVAVAVSDEPTRAEICAVLAAEGIAVTGFVSAAACLASVRAQSVACLIAEMELPDCSGLELQREIAASVPLIFVSGPCDTAAVVQAMKAGALEFLTKPVDGEALLSAVQAAFEHQRKTRSRQAESNRLEGLYARLSRREREVFALIAGGLQNKEAASVLGIANITLQIHRSNVMRKMQARSFAELVRMAVRLRIGSSVPSTMRCEARRDDLSYRLIPATL